MQETVRAYICSPLSANTKAETMMNIIRAREHMSIIRKIYGYQTYAPHVFLPEILDGNTPGERALALSFGMNLLELCDRFIICSKTVTKEMEKEITRAVELGMDIWACDIEFGYFTYILFNGRLMDEKQV